MSKSPAFSPRFNEGAVAVSLYPLERTDDFRECYLLKVGVFDVLTFRLLAEREFYRFIALLYGSSGVIPSMNSYMVSLASASRSIRLSIATTSSFEAIYPCFFRNILRLRLSIYPKFQSSIE